MCSWFSLTPIWQQNYIIQLRVKEREEEDYLVLHLLAALAAHFTCQAWPLGGVTGAVAPGGNPGEDS